MQVFFRAGVLGQMEDLRDDRIGLLLTWLQAWIRGYVARKVYDKLQKQRISLLVVQRNIRKYMKMRSWLWYSLWITLKPRLTVTRIEDELIALEEKAETAEKEHAKAVKVREELQATNATLLEAKNNLLMALDTAKGGVSEFLDKQNKLQSQKTDLENQLTVSYFEIGFIHSKNKSWYCKTDCSPL